MSATVAPHSGTAFVKKSRIIRANRQDVYDAWTKAEVLKKWYGPAGSVCTLAEIDARVGGIFRFACEIPDTAVPPGAPRSHLVEGVYTEVVPGERLQLTRTVNGSTSEHGLLTVSFRDVDGGTEVTVLHEKLESDLIHLYDAGWDGTLDKLDALFAA